MRIENANLEKQKEERQARWQKELLGRYAYTVEKWYEADWHEEAPWVRIEKKHEKHEEREL